MGMNNTTCCGIKEYHGISHMSSPEAVLKEIGKHLFTEGQDRSALVFFSDKVNNGSGKMGYATEKYIKAKGLGRVFSTNPKKNTNSNNDIVMWVWEYDRERFRNWWSLPQYIDKRNYSNAAIARYRASKALLRNLPTFAKMLGKS